MSTPQQLINKCMTAPLCSWPAPSRATNIEKIFIDFWWLLMFLTAWSSILPGMYTAYVLRHDFMELTKNVCFLASFSQGMIKMLICRWYRREFQELIEEVETYINHAKPHEQEILNAFIRKEGPLYVKLNMNGLMASVLFICGPLLLEQNFPMDAFYPFSTEPYSTFAIIYILQSITVVQCSTVGPVDTQFCMLIWYSTARLKLLANDIRNITSVDDLRDCIRVHQSILRFNERVTEMMKPIVGSTVIMVTISIAFGGIHVVGNEPFEAKVQFVGLDIGYALQLFLSVWAAENFMKAMDDVKWALYDSPWFQNSKEMNNSIIFVIQRLNKIPTISIGGFIPELSLNYYAVYLSKTMSFFTTLRVMLQKIEESLSEERDE